jgi:hypothetical protein
MPAQWQQRMAEMPCSLVYFGSTIYAAADSGEKDSLPHTPRRRGFLVLAVRRHATLPCMSDQETDDDQVAQRLDALLRRLLTTPPKTQAELAEELRRAKAEKPTRGRGRPANARTRGDAA